MREIEALSEVKISDSFFEGDFAKIKEVVRNAEANTSGEIRVVIRSRYSENLDGDIEAQAKHEFTKYGLGNTRDKTGVLILLVLDARKFIIWGDVGIHSKLPQGYWDMLSVGMIAHFQHGNYAEGICEAVSEVGRRLAQFFPRKPDDTNEIPDAVIVEEDKE